jgi:hypothetical protein
LETNWIKSVSSTFSLVCHSGVLVVEPDAAGLGILLTLACVVFLLAVSWATEYNPVDKINSIAYVIFMEDLHRVVMEGTLANVSCPLAFAY